MKPDIELSKVRPIPIVEGVRKKPSMFFGCSGPRVIIEMIKLMSEWLIRPEGEGLDGTLSVLIDGYPSALTVSISLVGPRVRCLPPLLRTSTPEEWYPRYVAGGSSFTEAHISQDGIQSSFKATENGVLQACESAPVADDSASFVFQPHLPSYGTLSEADLYRGVGILESIAILNPGLTVTLVADPGMKFAWSYSQGLKSFIQKGDHSRWSLHPGTLEFSAKKEGISVEGQLRFVHAGSSWMQSWINGHPSFGGSHYQGLGDVLAQMFPDPNQGCRRVAFITNSDTGDWIWLPHCFIGAMKLTLAEPRYAGPTKDILCDPAVREFVKQSAGASLPAQWAEAQRKQT